MLRIGCSGMFQDGSFSLPLVRGTSKYFSIIFCGKLVNLLEVNITILWPPWSPWNSHSCLQLSLQQFTHCSLQFPLLALVPIVVSYYYSIPVTHDHIYLSLQSWVLWFALCPVLHRSKYSCGFCKLFSFLFVVVMQ